MKIVSLNIWGGFAEYGLKGYLSERVTDTDIFCFQETDSGQAMEILNELFERNDYCYVGASKEFSEESRFGLRTYIRSTVELVDQTTLFGCEENIGLALETNLLVNGRGLTVVNVHGVSRPGDKLDTESRLRQSSGIIEHLKNQVNPQVICGDFNLLPETQSVAAFGQHGYHDLIKEFHIDTTRNHLAWDRFPDSKQLYADYAFTSSQVIVEKFEVPKNEVSDHLPLEINFSLQ